MRFAVFALSVLAALAAAADTPIATTLYKEGDGKIEGDLLADTVKRVSVSGDTVTVVQRDADAVESTTTFDVGGGSGGGASPAAWATTSASQPSADGQVLLRDGGVVEWDTVGTDSIADWAVTGAKIPNDAIASRHLAPALAEQTVPGGGTTGQVLAKASAADYDAAWTALAIPTLRTAAQTRDLLETLAGSARLPATAIRDLPSGGSGLTQTQVDARVKAGVYDWGETGDTDRIPEAKLPRKVDDLADAFDEGGWTDEPADAANSVYVASTFSTTQRPANPANFVGFSNSFSGPRETNVYAVIRKPTAVALSELRLAIGTADISYDDQQIFPSSGWTSLGVVGGYEYFTSQLIADVPVTTVRVQKYRPWTVDGQKIAGIGDFTPADRVKLDSISAGAEVNPRIATNAEVDAGVSQALRSYSPALVQRQIADSVADWAETGNGSQVPADKLPAPRTGALVVADGPQTGLAVTSNSANNARALVLFGSAGSYFDLDDADNQVGVLYVEAVLGISSTSRSSTSLGFDTSGNSSTALEIRSTEFAFAADLRGMDVFASNAGNGIEVLRGEVFLGTDKLGDISVFLGRNAASELGFFYQYTGGSAPPSGSQNWNFTLFMRVAFSHTEGASRSFIVDARPSATVSQTTTAADTYVPYEVLITAPAITAAQAGHVEIGVRLHADVTTDTTGGGERIGTRSNLKRRRGAATTTLVADFHFYGPRNVSNLDSADADWYWEHKTAAQAGDVFILEVQTASQVASRTTEFNATQNLMQITPF